MMPPARNRPVADGEQWESAMGVSPCRPHPCHIAEFACRRIAEGRIEELGARHVEQLDKLQQTLTSNHQDTLASSHCDSRAGQPQLGSAPRAFFVWQWLRLSVALSGDVRICSLRR